MKILVIHQFFLGRGEPGGTRFNDFARLWREAGHDVRVVASTIAYDSGSRASTEDPGGVHRAWTISHASGDRLRRLASMVGFGLTGSLSAVTFLRWRPDVVIATSPALTAAVPGMFAAARYRCPFVFEVRDLWPESAITTGVMPHDSAVVRAAEALEAAACEEADRVVGVTPAIVEDLVRRGLVGAERTATIPNGVDLGALPRVDRDAVRRRQGWEGKFVAIYAGAHGVANHLDQLVEAARLLQHRRDILLVSVGRGPERARLVAASRGVDNLQWLDAVPPEEAFGLVAASDAALVLLQDNPTFRTVYPNKMFVAMAAEVPVILAVDGIARDLVFGAGAGVFVPPQSPRDLAAAVANLAADPARALQMGWRGRACVAERFDRRDHAAQYLDLLQELVPPPAL